MAGIQASRLAQLSANASMLKSITGIEKTLQQQDVIRLDVPMFLRLLEYAREDAKQDTDLHELAEKLSDLCREGNIAKMRDYDKVVVRQKNKQSEDDEDDNKEKEDPQMPQMPPARNIPPQVMQ